MAKKTWTWLIKHGRDEEREALREKGNLRKQQPLMSIISMQELARRNKIANLDYVVRERGNDKSHNKRMQQIRAKRI